MYSLLIVDDEIHAVRGVLACLDWPDLQIAPVYTAYSLKQAIAILAEHPVDILVCDIEMPKGSGIDLLNWTQEHQPGIISILLTCHAEFEYAQKAVQLGVIEYLLKPVHARDLKAAVIKAIKILEESRLLSETKSSYLRYYQLWSESQMLIEEHFWLNLIDGQIESKSDQIHQQLDKINLPDLMDYRFQPVLLSIRGYPPGSDKTSQKALINALRNKITSEVLEKADHGLAIPIEENKVLTLVPFAQSSIFSLDQSINCWQLFIDKFKSLRNTDIVCYCDQACAIAHIPARLVHLLDIDQNNVIWKHQVINALNKSIAVANVQIPMMTGWADLLSLGEQQKLIFEIKQTMSALAMIEGFSLSHLRDQYHNLMQIIYSVLQQKGVQLRDVFNEAETKKIEFVEIQTIDDLYEISLLAVNRIAEYFKSLRQSQTLIEQIKHYISENIVNNPTRDEIASKFFLHPDYLTRKFRKETGVNLSDYLALERIRIAKDILINSSMPISDIVSFVGYSNMSHFSKIFKNATGMNPLDYRKNKRGSAT